MNNSKTKKRILVVDDENVILRLVTRLFKESPYELETADSVQKAMEKIESSRFDLLLTDLRLPDGNGVDVAKKFHQKFPDCKVLIMTGSLTPEDRINALTDVPIEQCLAKPFDLDVMKEAVDGLLGG